MYVIKKDGTREEFNVDKIIAAVNKSAARILYEFSTDEIAFICQFAYDRAESLKKDGITIQEMHNIVEGALERVNPAVAKSYRDYRNYKLDFIDRSNCVYCGAVQGTVQRDIRYVSFNTLPMWIDDAKEKLTTAPNLQSGDFTSQKVKFNGGQKFPVYTGPGTNYARSGNGKGLVSTNGWIEVYGQKDGWILIQYSISSDHYRFGWIEKSALPKGTTVPELNFRVAPGDQSVAFNRDSYLTDDPLVSRAKLCTVKAETDIFYLGSLNDEWAYVMVETADGRWMCGFMPHEDISNG